MQRVGQSAQQMGRQVQQAGQVVSQGFRSVGQSAQQMERQVDQAERGMARFSRTGAALGAIAGTVAGALSEAARAAAEEEATFAQLEAAVAATGQEFDALAPSLDRHIAQAEDMSFADDEAATALTRLTTITGDAEEALDLLALTMDVARGRGISLADAATLVGRVAEGNTAILTRYGIAIEEGATATEALASLQQRYGGQAQAFADTTQGAIDRIRNAFDNWAESVGASTGELQVFLALLPGLQVGFTGLTTIAGGLARALGPVGLGLTAIGAAAAILELTGVIDLFGSNSADATVDVDNLTEAIYGLYQAGASEDLILALTAVDERWQAYLATLGDVEAMHQRIEQIGSELMIDQAIDTLTDQQVEALKAERAALEATLATIEAGGGVEAINGVSEALSELANLATERGVDTVTFFDDLNEQLRRLESGEITPEQFLSVLQDMIANFNELYVTLPQATGALDDHARAMEEAEEAALALDEAWASQALTLDAVALAEQANTDALARHTEGVTEQIAATQESQAAHAAWMDQQIAARGVITQNVEAMDSLALASHIAADGIVTLAEQETLLGKRMDETTTQLGFYRSAVNDMEAAYAELQARQQAGETLTQSDILFMQEYEAESADTARTIGDLVIEQGKLAQAQIDNAEAQGELTDSMEDTSDAILELVDTLRELFGLDPRGTNLFSGLSELAGLITAIGTRGELPTGGPASSTGYTVVQNPDGSYSSVPPPPGSRAAGESTTGGHTPGSPPNLPPPSQDLLGPQTVVTTHLIRYQTDAEGLAAAIEEDLGYVEQLLGEELEYTITLNADGTEAYAVLTDLEGDVRAVVTDDYVVILEGNADGALSEAEAVELAMNAIDGKTSVVYVDADTADARAEINSLVGYQGDAYIDVYARNVGPAYGPGYRHGGMIGIDPEPLPARHGRMVTVGENGPETVYLPVGSTVSPHAPRGRGGINVGTVVIYADSATNGRRVARDFVAEMTAVGR
jgi:hypothetical protein